MKKINLKRLLSLFLIAFISKILVAQEIESTSDTIRKDAVKIFLDCQSCDMNYTREQINFANFERLRFLFWLLNRKQEAGELNIHLRIRGYKYLKG